MRLTPELLLQAYAVGVFPMAESRKADSLHWVAPERRGLLSLNQFHVPRRLLRTFRSGKFFCTLNHAPHEVIHNCATAHGETWINREIEELYCGLATRKTVHSIEVWQNLEADTEATTRSFVAEGMHNSTKGFMRETIKSTNENTPSENTHKESIHKENSYKANSHKTNSIREITHNEITPKRNIHREESMKEIIKAANKNTHNENTHKENTNKESIHNKNSPKENSYREESMKEIIKAANENIHSENTNKENTNKENIHNKNSPRENSHREESMKEMIKAAKNRPTLVGGLYGLSLGGIFFGESMFSLARDASKVALVELVLRLRHGRFVLLDTQFLTPHLAQFGTEEVSREAYQEQLAKALTISATLSSSFTDQDRARLLTEITPHD